MKKLLLGLSAIACFNLASAQITGYSVGQTVADFTVTDKDGNTHNLYSITASGKYVMLDFFFVTCVPCQQTTPIFNQLHDKYGCNDGDLFCMSVNTGNDNNAQVTTFENTYGGTYSHAPAVSGDGGAGAVDAAFNPSAYPTYCLIGPDNKLINADIWPISSVASFEAAFPGGSNITPMACTALSISEELEVSTNLFPNPANDVLNVQLSTEMQLENVSIEITDLTGRKVLSIEEVELSNKSLSVNTSDLAVGSYIINVLNNGKYVSTSRFLIAR